MGSTALPLQKKPAKHGPEGAGLPAPLQNCPGGQAKHAANEEFPPLTLPKLPGGQGEGAAAPGPHHAPGGHNNGVTMPTLGQ